MTHSDSLLAAGMICAALIVSALILSRRKQDPPAQNQAPTTAEVSADAVAAATEAIPALVLQEIVDLLQQRRKIEAINVYRRHHPGVGLKDAKDAVERIERLSL